MAVRAHNRKVTRAVRSKLEQHFADYLTVHGLLWKYEPKAFQLDSFTWYTPDFFVQVKRETIIVELKPTLDQMLEDTRLRRLNKQVSNICLAVWGRPGKWSGLPIGVDEIWLSDEPLRAFIGRL